MNLFWSVEPRYPDVDLINQALMRDEQPSLRILSLDDPKRQIYGRVATLTEQFIDQSTNQSRTAEAFYLAAMSYSILGQHQQAVNAIDRVLTQFPEMKRSRLPGYRIYDRPVRADLMHLKLFHLSQMQRQSSPLRTLENAVQESIAILRERGEWRAAIQGQAHIAERQFREELEHRNPTPDQLRTAALPPLFDSIVKLHEVLLPAVISSNGAKATRDYLRGLGASGNPFQGYASYKLLAIDKDIVAHYRQEAQRAWQAKLWAQARSAFQQIIHEYEGTETAKKAELDLKNVIAAQYRDEGDTAFGAKKYREAKMPFKKIVAEFPGTPHETYATQKLQEIRSLLVNANISEGDRLMKPPGQRYQEARLLYEKALEEDPNGQEAPHALLMLAECFKGLGQANAALRILDELERRNPQSDFVAAARHERGMTQLWVNADPKKTLQSFQEVVARFPNSSKAHEALYFSGYLLWQAQRLPEAIKVFEDLLIKYPTSPYVAWAKKDLDLLKQAGEKKL